MSGPVRGTLTIVLLVAVVGVAAGRDSSSGRRPPTAPSPASCRYRDGGVLPDPRCTPGATDPRVTQATIKRTVCAAGWSASVRPPASVTEPWKFASMRDYGVPTTPGHAGLYEYDHLIPIELGGASVRKNLWPEPHTSSRAKDAVENRLRAEVCAGDVKLAVARREIRTNWTTAR